MEMLKNVSQAFKVPEIRRKMIFTLLMLGMTEAVNRIVAKRR